MPTAWFFEVVLLLELVYNEGHLAHPASSDAVALAGKMKDRK
jgi:hypothetical protein